MVNSTQIDSYSDDTPIITVGDLKATQEKWLAAVQKFSEAERNLIKLDQTLTAIEAIWSKAAFDRSEVMSKLKRQGSLAMSSPVKVSGPAKGYNPRPPSTRSLIKEILEDYPQGVSGAEVHRVLASRGIETHINYVYKCLSMLREKDLAIQAQDKSYRLTKYRNHQLITPQGQLEGLEQQSPDREGQG